jgi:hypothetical protein
MRVKLPISAYAGTLQRNKFLLFLVSGRWNTATLPNIARGVSQHVPWYTACTCVSSRGELGEEVRWLRGHSLYTILSPMFLFSLLLFLSGLPSSSSYTYMTLPRLLICMYFLIFTPCMVFHSMSKIFPAWITMAKSSSTRKSKTRLFADFKGDSLIYMRKVWIVWLAGLQVL